MDIRKHPLHPLFVTLPPGKGSSEDLVRHMGYEFIFCFSGEIHYCVEDASFTLLAGDSLFFNARRLHSWVNPTSDPAAYLLLLIPEDDEEMVGEIHFRHSGSSGQIQ